MATYNPEEKQLNIVLIGNFNPRIFQPQWFADHEIISEADLNFINEQDEVLIHKQVSQFKSSWFVLEVTETRLQMITTQEAYFEVVLDFLTSTFSVLHHTPIQQMGVNLSVIQNFERNEDITKFDKEYFPVGGFSKIDKEVQSFLTKLKFNNQEIKIGTQCNLEISKITEKGYNMSVNQHFELGQDANGKEFVRTLGKNGRKSINSNNDLLKSIIEKKAKT